MSEATRAGATKTAPAPAHLFGFCQTEAKADGQPTGASAWHGRCPGALTTPKGPVLCSCPSHSTARKCHVCLAEVEPSEEYDTALRKHTNAEACEIASDLRRASQGRGLAQQLAQIVADTEARRLAERRAQNEARASRGEATVKLRVKREPPKPQRCHCGCGGMTKGGRFVPGHDAKLKSRLATLDDLNTDDRGHARWIAQLAERVARTWAPWPMPVADPVLAGEVDKYIADAGGPEAVIERAVEGRYADN